MTGQENDGLPDASEADAQKSDDLEIKKKWLKRASIDIEEFTFCTGNSGPRSTDTSF